MSDRLREALEWIANPPRSCSCRGMWPHNTNISCLEERARAALAAAPAEQPAAMPTGQADENTTRSQAVTTPDIEKLRGLAEKWRKEAKEDSKFGYHFRRSCLQHSEQLEELLADYERLLRDAVRGERERAALLTYEEAETVMSLLAFMSGWYSDEPRWPFHLRCKNAGELMKRVCVAAAIRKGDK